MSLLFADQTENWALLISDTLTATTEKEPYTFSSKVRPFPHLNMAVSTLGSGWMGAAWCDVVERSPEIEDIETANSCAPETLRALWGKFMGHPGPKPQTATVYHFGFPAGSEKLVRYTYRSTNGFEAERFEGSKFTVKPVPPDFKCMRPQSKAEVIELALRVREINDAEDGWGVLIGGDLQATMIENHTMWVERWHRFDDYDETARAIRARANEK